MATSNTARIIKAAWLAEQPNIVRRNWTVSTITGFCTALVVGHELIATDARLRVI